MKIRNTAGLKGLLAFLLIIGCSKGAHELSKTAEMSRLDSINFYTNYGWVDYYNGRIEDAIINFNIARSLTNTSKWEDRIRLELIYEGLSSCYSTEKDTTAEYNSNEQTYE